MRRPPALLSAELVMVKRPLLLAIQFMELEATLFAIFPKNQKNFQQFSFSKYFLLSWKWRLAAQLSVLFSPTWEK
jgi:hypothetical protein